MGPRNDVPQQYQDLNVQSLICENKMDGDNPTGGMVKGQGLEINWQDGPRTPDAEGNLAPSNGAFVEDAIYAALQRLEFFNDSKYAHPSNTDAINHLKLALNSLNQRRQERAERGVEGQHEV